MKTSLRELLERAINNGADREERLLKIIEQQVADAADRKLIEDGIKQSLSHISTTLNQSSELINDTHISVSGVNSAVGELKTDTSTKFSELLEAQQETLEVVKNTVSSSEFHKEVERILKQSSVSHSLIMQRFEAQDEAALRAYKKSVRQALRNEARLKSMEAVLMTVAADVEGFSALEDSLRSTGNKFLNLLKHAEEKIDGYYEEFGSLIEEVSHQSEKVTETTERISTISNDIEVTAKLVKDYVAECAGLYNILEVSVKEANRQANHQLSNHAVEFRSYVNEAKENNRALIQHTQDTFEQKLSSFRDTITQNTSSISGSIEEFKGVGHGLSSLVNELNTHTGTLATELVSQKLSSQQVERFQAMLNNIPALTNSVVDLNRLIVNITSDFDEEQMSDD